MNQPQRQPCGCEAPWSYCDIGAQLQAAESDTQLDYESARDAGDAERATAAFAVWQAARAAFDRHVGIAAETVDVFGCALQHLARRGDAWSKVLLAAIPNLQDDAAKWGYLLTRLRARGWQNVTPKTILARLPQTDEPDHG